MADDYVVVGGPDEGPADARGMEEGAAGAGGEAESGDWEKGEDERGGDGGEAPAAGPEREAERVPAEDAPEDDVPEGEGEEEEGDWTAPPDPASDDENVVPAIPASPMLSVDGAVAPPPLAIIYPSSSPRHSDAVQPVVLSPSYRRARRRMEELDSPYRRPGGQGQGRPNAVERPRPHWRGGASAPTAADCLPAGGGGGVLEDRTMDADKAENRARNAILRPFVPKRSSPKKLTVPRPPRLSMSTRTTSDRATPSRGMRAPPHPNGNGSRTTPSTSERATAATAVRTPNGGVTSPAPFKLSYMRLSPKTPTPRPEPSIAQTINKYLRGGLRELTPSAYLPTPTKVRPFNLSRNTYTPQHKSRDQLEEEQEEYIASHQFRATPVGTGVLGGGGGGG